MARRLRISDARARLPELARYLSRSPHAVVFIEHRDLEERLVLITERHLRYLEAMVDGAKRRRAGSFKLAGSVSSSLSDKAIEEALAAIRSEQRARAKEKGETL
jgi:hypothetical protein